MYDKASQSSDLTYSQTSSGDSKVNPCLSSLLILLSTAQMDDDRCPILDTILNSSCSSGKLNSIVARGTCVLSFRLMFFNYNSVTFYCSISRKAAILAAIITHTFFVYYLGPNETIVINRRKITICRSGICGGSCVLRTFHAL